MKSLIAALLAVASLAGCVAVPYYGGPYESGYYYGPPAATFHFNYDYRRHGHRHRHR